MEMKNKQAHSPEPWNVVGKDPHAPEPWGIVDAKGHLLVNARYGGQWEDFDRTCACVNACKGMPTEGIGEIIRAMKAVLAQGGVSKLRDTAILDAVRNMRAICQKHGFEVEENS